MKKCIVISLFFVFNISIFAQENIILEYINNCIDLLGKPLPNIGFQRINRDVYRKTDNGILLLIENGQIVFSTVGTITERSDEAALIISYFYDYFEKNNWNYYGVHNNFDVYYNNGVYAGISEVARREDGYMVAMVGFSRNIDYINIFY
jgi:hypothetical protein